ncbi:hypothetical protein ACMHYB_06550 [Sorangium sp. So ce1128]
MRPSRSSSMRESANGVRARAVSDEPLAALIVARRDAHGAVYVEPVARRREAALLALEIRVGVVFELTE